MYKFKKDIQHIKEKSDVFKKIPFPNSPERGDAKYASTFADLVLLDTQIAGILDSLFSCYHLTVEQKKYLFN